MYYVNREQIAVRLNAIPDISEALTLIAAEWNGGMLQGLAQERALHLAVETVTDVGSYLIDGFMMRDASSYEDIVDVTGAEGVFSAELLPTFKQLVQLRRPLVQQYYEWQRGELHPLTRQLAPQLLRFKQEVELYLERELVDFEGKV
ncbi:Uncharacterized conserved protein YutE, UPF0331/DUF86 family [Paenibacillus algorifonticola]|uniref:Uncharacterized conserved protein YutE, UPF0331/DUF86 family n=1 Tax=Paenibacillus algorifonticola TaxID=684063 RepID=A0A1I2A4S2_9BACL|nr:HepT-like ribonuclease domain-containing protein [Paenibacillus algorifonticola]SFE37760.1 Uncharacterized conserved protein YutE, UPF0331/DUF86 family [Paenibacillus algorifonticola]